MKKNFKKSLPCRNFRILRLIELLVVVAIIAILASIVLSSSSDSRNKANEAGVKAYLNTVRGCSRTFYSNNGEIHFYLLEELLFKCSCLSCL